MGLAIFSVGVVGIVTWYYAARSSWLLLGLSIFFLGLGLVAMTEELLK